MPWALICHAMSCPAVAMDKGERVERCIERNLLENFLPVKAYTKQPPSLPTARPSLKKIL